MSFVYSVVTNHGGCALRGLWAVPCVERRGERQRLQKVHSPLPIVLVLSAAVIVLVIGSARFGASSCHSFTSRDCPEGTDSRMAGTDPGLFEHEIELTEYAENFHPKTIVAGGAAAVVVAGLLVDNGYIAEIALPEVALFESTLWDSVTIEHALQSTWQLGESSWELTDDGSISELSTNIAINLPDNRTFHRCFTTDFKIGIDHGRSITLENPGIGDTVYTIGITFKH